MQNPNSDGFCPQCGSGRLIKKTGRFGDFTACSNFPECKYIEKEKKEEAQKTGIMCDVCGEGELVVRKGRFGNFYACSRYPQCRNTKKIGTNGEPIEAKPRSFSN